MATILIDADACPVVDETIRIAKQFGFRCMLICDTTHEMHRDGAETIIVSKGADAVDFVLVNRVQKNDIVVTQDYGLAAMVLAKQGHPIDQNGRLYTEDNMDQLLYARHTAQKIRMAGGRLRGPKKRSKESNVKFEASMRALCQRIAKIESNT
ncbi:YaiI/YqxD family protein [Sporosarcina sp. FSL W7-1349]|uniref:YaiI/YqxD family protein n=1 Tax=Sporosarcina sp. FSL W7-1349 TaxID=2921561 RepID=UPI0030F54336